MKTITNPLTLSSILLNAYDPESEMAKSYPCEELFDFRHDFLMNFKQTSLAVLMIFANERSLTSKPYAGVRRKVAVSLIDATEQSLITTTEIIVSMGRYDETKSMRVDFPFAYANINTEHTYKVRVRDENSHKVLGEQHLNMFDENRFGKHVTDWFNVYEGGISPCYIGRLYRSICADSMEYNLVRFKLHTTFKEMPLILPEVEVRVHYPDGEVESRFRQIECEDFDMNEYYIEMPFFVTDRNKGICYTELICMDFLIAGFVFCTSAMSDYADIPWSGKDLQCLEEYSLDAATERYRKAINADLHHPDETDNDLFDSDEPDTDTDSEEGEDFDAEDFDKLLEDFINSHLEKNDESEIDTKENEDSIDNKDSIEDEDNTDNEGYTDNEDNAVNDDIITNEDSILNEDSTENETSTEISDDNHKESDEISNENQFSLLNALDNLTGLNSVKEKLSVYEKLVRFNRMRSDNGLSVIPIPLHSIFLGSPGTGKTTVAKKMGLMLHNAGVLSKGHVVIKERANLLGPYYSNEETNTMKAIEEAQGGILFIDEAYQLYQPKDPRDPGKFVIETLLTALADESNRDWMLILAGYPDEMKQMFDMNPGFRSRIPESNIYVFEDFSDLQLMEIAQRYFERNNYRLTPEAHDALSLRLTNDYANRSKSFGNARHVINLIQTEIIPAMAKRVLSKDSIQPEDLSSIEGADIPTGVTILCPTVNRIGYRA